METHNIYRRRRAAIAFLFALGIALFGILSAVQEQQSLQNKGPKPSIAASQSQQASVALEQLALKGRAPKTGYTRTQFGNGWRISNGCSTREFILIRDLTKTNVRECKVYSGTLSDPYTGKEIAFLRGKDTSDDVQIDHVVALSDAWQKGAQNLDAATREELANDPLELLAVEGRANQDKSDGDAATWLPPNKAYRCRYVARQIAVKQKYSLWMTAAEKTAIKTVLATCPTQQLPQ